MTSTRKVPAEAKPKTVSVLTTRPWRLGPRGFAGGIVIEGVPVDAVDPVWQDCDAANVRAARKAGAAVLQYKA